MLKLLFRMKKNINIELSHSRKTKNAPPSFFYNKHVIHLMKSELNYSIDHSRMTIVIKRNPVS